MDAPKTAIIPPMKENQKLGGSERRRRLNMYAAPNQITMFEIVSAFLLIWDTW